MPRLAPALIGHPCAVERDDLGLGFGGNDAHVEFSLAEHISRGAESHCLGTTVDQTCAGRLPLLATQSDLRLDSSNDMTEIQADHLADFSARVSSRRRSPTTAAVEEVQHCWKAGRRLCLHASGHRRSRFSASAESH